MRSFFNLDSPLMQFLSKVADLMILNLIFIISCIPIFTIGPALTALNYVTLKMANNKDPYIIRSFFKSFRQNFKQALIIWLVMLLFGGILWFDISHVWGAEGVINKVVQMLSIVAVIGYILVLLYVFPVLAQFHNTITKTLRNAVGISLTVIFRTISMFVLIFACVLLTFYTIDTFKYCTFFWLTLGFSSLAYANSFLLKKTFAKYIEQPEEQDTLNNLEENKLE